MSFRMKTGLQDKVIIVTGAATGIGRRTAAELGALGAKVVVSTGSNTAGGESSAQEIRDAGGRAVFIRCDVTREDEVENLIAKTVEEFGRLDGAFNNAGIGPDGVRIGFGPLTELDADVWDRIMEVNSKGVFLCLKHELRQLQKQGGGGAIVNTASVGGLRMAPGFGAYGPSKAAVAALTRAAAVENAKDGIRVNAVCPGPTLGTELMSNSMTSGGEAAGGDDGPPIPLGKMGTTEDVANAVAWLLSDLSGHVTGHALSVDGGMADIG